MRFIGQGNGKWHLTQENVNVYTLVMNANPKHEYTMGAQNIAHSTEEKDLGVVINQSLSPSHHIATCVSRANRLVGLIKRTYENKSKRNIIALYNRVRTHPGKPGIYWNFIIRIPGLEYTGIVSKVLENTGI